VLRKNNEKMMPVIDKAFHNYLQDQDNKEPSFEDIYKSAASEIDDFCKAEANYDIECFNISTQ